ncbi:PD-(D/E)XK nuclease family protein [Candidatus Woesearchaeota archaeon]|nr:PD-(D/E)XK nuclease family protein [Candidatus Woesearchaeota archaeon]
MHDIQFIEDGHKYIVKGSGQRLIPATEFLSDFFEKFDEDKWSKYVAQRDKIPVEEVLRRWKAKGEAAASFGSLVHSYAESIIMKRPLPDAPDTRHGLYFKAVDRFMDDEGYRFIDAEKVIGCPRMGLGGTVDAVAEVDGKIFLIDWKTNSKIDRFGYNDRRCLEPISHLQDCNFSKYRLQLSLYRYILEEVYGWKVSGLRLVHLRPEVYDVHEVEYLKEEIIKLLEVSGRL